MVKRALIIVLSLVVAQALRAAGTSITVPGVVTSTADGAPVEFATIVLGSDEQWGMTDQQGRFALQMSHGGRTAVKATYVGYEPAEAMVTVAPGMDTVRLVMRPSNLMLEQVVVTAQRKSEHATTSYLIDSHALNNQQIINIGDVGTLLPGGKTVNSSLMNDTRMALRAEGGEMGNAAFGTAVEVDGQRLQNNAEVGETDGVSTRAISTTNVASIEVVPGIPSVEYGDLSNGIVKVNTKRGHTPWEITLSTNPHTKQVAVSKGFDLSRGVLNASLEHTRSYSSLASPHTAYQRNTATLNYRTQASLARHPLLVNVNLSGNVGGYNSKADPDQFADTYTRMRDRVLRGSLRVDWNPGQRWLSSLMLHADFSLADKRRTSLYNDNRSSAQAQIHALEAGYYISTDYDADPQAPIILGPTGYWMVKSFNDNRPQSTLLKLKAQWNQQGQAVKNRAMAGVEWSATGNGGRGTYYDDMRYAPTWREYRYDHLPWMHNVAVYGEDRLTLATNELGGSLLLTAGARADITHIGQSAYGTVASISPRFNAKYVLWADREGCWLSGLNVHAGWGKSVKLPSFEVLYPAPSYADRLAFVPPSTADNRAFYAYNVTPFKAVRNPDLKWQYARQLEMGFEATTRIATVSVSAFVSRTMRPYLRTGIFTPYTYRFTSQSALEGDFPIPPALRDYSIDAVTGLVTVSDRSGISAPVTLPATEQNTFNVNSTYVNGSSVRRWGLDWIVDFKQIPALRTSFRLDGSYYHYRGEDHTSIASVPSGAQYMADGITPYQYVGHYSGTVAGGGSAIATVPNGSVTRCVNSNLTIVTHIPSIRLIISLRIESTLFDTRRSLSRGTGGAPRGYVLADATDYFGEPYTGEERDCYVALWPDYYTTWSQPDVPVPFAERFLWARDHDRALFNELSQLVVKTSHRYDLNPDRLSAYVSGNINITKEIGDHVSVSFLANNFWNSMARIKSSQTGLRTTIYNAGYIPPFYYGLSLRVKL